MRTDADVLHLGPPDPELTTKRWLPPDHGLRVHVVVSGWCGRHASCSKAAGPGREAAVWCWSGRLLGPCAHCPFLPNPACRCRPPASLPALLKGEEELEGVLAALDTATGPAPRLWRLQLSASAWFALPSGALVPVVALEGSRGRQLLRERWQAAALRREADSAGTQWLTLEWCT